MSEFQQLTEKVDALSTEVSEIKQTLSELKELINTGLNNQIQLCKLNTAGFEAISSNQQYIGINMLTAQDSGLNSFKLNKF